MTVPIMQALPGSGGPRRATNKAGMGRTTMLMIGSSRQWICSKTPNLFGPPENDDALLRWNACVRYLSRHKELTEKTEETPETILLE
jgi:hypothetical protein